MTSTTQGSCPYCSAPIEAGNFFCDRCGHRLPDAHEASTGTRAAPPEPPTGHQPGPASSDTQQYPYLYPGGAAAPSTGWQQGGYSPAPASRPQAAPHLVGPATYADVAVDPLVGRATPNETYLGNRLTYSDAATPLDPMTNPSYLRALAARFIATVVAWMFGQGIIFVLFLITGAHQYSTQSYDAFGGTTGGDVTGEFQALGIISLLYSLVLAVAFWFVKLPVQLTEWMLTIDGRGSAARAAIEHMFTIVRVRYTPVSRLRVVQTAPTRRGHRDYIEVADGIYTGIVSCFPHGTDLFIGWSFCLALCPARWVVIALGRMFRRGSILNVAMFDDAKAMREVLHSVVRQGVDVAVDEADAAGGGSFGVTVPIEYVS